MAEGLDHDPPPAREWTPLGIRRVATGALTVIFGSREASDFWVGGRKLWWGTGTDQRGSSRRRVRYLDNGPNNSGTRTQFLKRLVGFADGSGLEMRLVDDPPYHSKSNPVERYWSILEQKWGGALLNRRKVILQQAPRMTRKGRHPTVKRLAGDYRGGIRRSKKAKTPYEARLERSPSLRRYDITVKPSGR